MTSLGALYCCGSAAGGSSPSHATPATCSLAAGVAAGSLSASAPVGSASLPENSAKPITAATIRPNTEKRTNLWRFSSASRAATASSLNCFLRALLSLVAKVPPAVASLSDEICLRGDAVEMIGDRLGKGLARGRLGEDHVGYAETLQLARSQLERARRILCPLCIPPEDRSGGLGADHGE